MRFLLSAIFLFFLCLGCDTHSPATPVEENVITPDDSELSRLDWSPLPLKISESDSDFYSHGINLSQLMLTEPKFSYDFQQGINAEYLRGSAIPYNPHAPKWRYVQIQNPHGVQILTDKKNGNNILRAYWERGAGAEWDSNTQKKIQIYGNFGAHARQEEVWAFQSAYLTSGFDYDSYAEILVQFHENPDSCEFDRKPPMVIQNQHDSILVIWRNDERKCTPANFDDWHERSRYLGKLPKDQVLNWIVHIRWDPSGAGAVTVILNNKVLLMEDNLFIGYEDDVSPYIGWGIYKFPNTSDHPSRIAYYDNFKQWILR